MTKATSASSAKRRPFLKFFTNDWRADAALRMCGYAARGLWIDLLSLMHEAAPYGHLVGKNGKSLTPKQLAGLLGGGEREVQALIDELIENGVCGVTSEGIIYSRRMVRDREKEEQARGWGLTGGNPNLTPKDNASDRESGGTPYPSRPPNSVGPLSPGDKPHRDHHIPLPLPEAATSERAPTTLEALMARTWTALGVADATGVPISLCGRMREAVEGLLAENCDFDADIAPALKRRPEGGLWPGSVAFWIKIARGNRDKRVASTVTGGPPQRIEIGEQKQRALVCVRNGIWAPSWGPKRGESGCLVSEEIFADAEAFLARQDAGA